MSKRLAQKQLTLENFEDEDRDEEESGAGRPQLASSEVLKSRTMAKAKRKSDLNSPSDETQKRTAFTGFQGFKGFGLNSLQNSSSLSAFQALPPMQTMDTPLQTLTTTSSLLSQTNGEKSVCNEKTNESNEDSDELYDKKLSELNKCFHKHINDYMNRSDYYDFTQVCNEYIQYHTSIVSETKSETNTSQKTVSANTANTVKSLSQSTGISDSQKSSQTPGFGLLSTFGLSSTTSSLSSQASDVQSSVSSIAETTPKPDETLFAKPNIQFNFGDNKSANTGFSSGTISEPTVDPSAEEERDEPPKVESVEHKEPDSVFTRKCKLFFKKGNDWANKGVGYLFVKKDGNSAGAQLLIRADNTLGTILLNISLVESLPISKAPSNKGVMITCIPNPPLDPKADSQTSVTFLIRVRPEDSEPLFNNLNKYKSK